MCFPGEVCVSHIVQIYCTDYHSFENMMDLATYCHEIEKVLQGKVSQNRIEIFLYTYHDFYNVWPRMHVVYTLLMQRNIDTLVFHGFLNIDIPIISYNTFYSVTSFKPCSRQFVHKLLVVTTSTISWY